MGNMMMMMMMHRLVASHRQHAVHLPSTHFSFQPQRCQQPPQLFSFRVVLTQIVAEPQGHAAPLSDGQPHLPLTQDWPAGQVLKHVLQ
jgi:hypothetical protein